MLIHTLSQILCVYQPQDTLPSTSNAPTPKRDSNHTSEQRLAGLHKRDVQKSEFWALSQISTPPNFDWYNDLSIQKGIFYYYYFHSSQGEEQYIYLLEDGIWPNHPVN